MSRRELYGFDRLGRELAIAGAHIVAVGHDPIAGNAALDPEVVGGLVGQLVNELFLLGLGLAEVLVEPCGLLGASRLQLNGLIRSPISEVTPVLI